MLTGGGEIIVFNEKKSYTEKGENLGF